MKYRNGITRRRLLASWTGGMAAAGLAAAAAPALAALQAQEAAADTVYLFTSFRGNGEDGLHLAFSEDGYRWTDLGRSFVQPRVGVSKLMRDPSLLRGPDGVFHMVWTSGWEERGIGYARSRDLVQWSEQKYFPVMVHEPTTLNTWAPELTYDPERQEFLIYWASTIPGRFPGDNEHPKHWNHRIYYTTTRDFETLSPTRLLFDPGYSAIDSVIVRRGPADYVMVFKDEREAGKKLRTAFSRSITGPYGEISEPFTDFHTEGPTVLRVGDEWIVYFDKYTRGQYGAAKTRDFKSWTDISDRVTVPRGQRHGTALEVPRVVVEALRKR